MYKIIGADQKEYGPVTADQVRRWIVDDRADGETRARGENETEWRALSTFPEFAEALGGKPAGQAPPRLESFPDGDREAARRRVKMPAITLMIAASLNFLLGVWDLAAMIISPPNPRQYDAELRQLNNPQVEQFVRQLVHVFNGPFAVAGGGLSLAISVLIFMGALRMHALRSYEFSMTVAVLAMVPCLTSCCFLGLPFGIWAVIALREPGVKAQFH